MRVTTHIPWFGFNFSPGHTSTILLASRQQDYGERKRQEAKEPRPVGQSQLNTMQTHDETTKYYTHEEHQVIMERHSNKMAALGK